MQNALAFSHQLLKDVLQPGELAVDATMGNGHDTLFLAQLVGRSGHVYACDLQAQALVNTRQRLTNADLLSGNTPPVRSRRIGPLLARAKNQRRDFQSRLPPPK